MNMTKKISHHLEGFSQVELIALICDFLEDLGPKQQAHFLEYIEMGLPPVVAESMG